MFRKQISKQCGEAAMVHNQKAQKARQGRKRGREQTHEIGT
jgi:hypothetical protein